MLRMFLIVETEDSIISEVIILNLSCYFEKKEAIICPAQIDSV
jgi:hypothetical protein